MYFGGTPVRIDWSTAQHILRQRESMPESKAWGSFFPAVTNHTSASCARSHPDFEAAKNGDFDAALRLVDTLVKDERIKRIAEEFPNAHIVYNHRMHGKRINMIPAAYAAKFSAAGMKVEHDIIAITDVSHTNASDIARISKRMRYEGNVTQGADYILLDDFITSGAELRDMRDYIQSKGGNVVAMTTLGHGSYGKLSDIRINEQCIESLKQNGITDKELRKYGIASAIGCLTLSEGAKLVRLVNSRAKAAAARISQGMSAAVRDQRGLPELAGTLQGGTRETGGYLQSTPLQKIEEMEQIAARRIPRR